MPEYIYYTGVGARKDGKHTIKQFLAIMNKNYGMGCKLRNVARKSLKYSPCKKADKIFRYELSNPSKKQYTKSEKKTKIGNFLKKNEKIFKECSKYKETLMKTEPGCSIDDYLEFSGAEHKK